MTFVVKIYLKVTRLYLFKQRLAVAALYDDSYSVGAAYGALLVQRQTHPGNIELLANDAYTLFCERFDQLKFALADKLNQAFGYSLVIERVVNMVSRGSPGDIGRHLDIEHDNLANLALPLVDTNNCIDSQVSQEYNVHHKFFIELYFAGLNGDTTQSCRQRKLDNTHGIWIWQQKTAHRC